MVFGIKHSLLILLVILSIVKASFALTYTLTDKLGRSVSVEIPVKRAVVVITYELIPALRVWDQVVGVSMWAEKSCDLYRAIVSENPSLRKPLVGAGSNLNIEAILKLAPDIVITWSYNPENVRFLEKREIKTIAIYPDSLTELYQVIRMHGRLFGKPNRAQELIREMEGIFDLIEKRVSGIPDKMKRKAIHIGGKPNRVSCGIGVTDDIINLIGGINPAGKIKKRYADVPIEMIVKWNPDVIFIWGSAGYDTSWIYKNSQWRFIDAVKNRKVFKLPRWSTWSPRLAPISLYMAKRLYPERFKDIEFESLTDRFYKKLFGISYHKVKEYERF